MTGSDREALPEVREWSGSPPGCPGVVGRPSRKSGILQEFLPEVWVWSGGPPGSPGVVGRSSKKYRSLR